MKRMLIVTAAVLALAACEREGGQAGQEARVINEAQDSAGAATGLATAAVGAVSAEVFVRDAAIGDMYEVEAGKLALARSKSAEVRALAQMLVTDHTASSEKLKMLVASGQVKEALPTEMDERRKGLLDNLNAAGGVDFDGRFLKQQTAAHHEAVALFEGYKTVGGDPVLKAFAEEVAPKLQAHMDMANKLDLAAAGHIGKATAPPAAPAK